jgi:hypothetical protein
MYLQLWFLKRQYITISHTTPKVKIKAYIPPVTVGTGITFYLWTEPPTIINYDTSFLLFDVLKLWTVLRHDENKHMHMNTSAGSRNFYYAWHAFEPKNFPNQTILTYICTGTSPYLIICITLHSDNFTWQVVQYSLLFQFAESQSTQFSILVQLIAVNSGSYSL